jgi:hypothetical protein
LKEDELQLASHQLNKIAKEYNMSVSTEKTKAMAMCGNVIKRVKIEIENRIIEQVSDFKYLGHMFSDQLKDIDIKLQTYNKLNGVIKRNFGKQMTTETKLKLHNITSKPALKYGSKTWVMNKRDTQRLEAAQMRFLRPLLGYTRLDRQRKKASGKH